MAWEQNVVVTVIPAGSGGTGGATRRFSIHIAPRLKGASYLNSFPDFVDWADFALKGLKTVHLFRLGAAPTYTKIGTPIPATRISSDPDSTLWRSLFRNPGSLPVDDFSTTSFGERFKFTRYHSYPVMPLHDFHSKFLTDLAINNETVSPAESALQTQLADLVRAVDPDTRGRTQQKIDTAFAKGDSQAWTQVLPHGSGRPGTTAAERNTADHLQLIRFLQPRTDPDWVAKSEVQQPRLDFHRIVAMLADHPYLMRLLGLVMDYEIDAGQVGEAGQFSTTQFLQLDPSDWTGLDGTVAFPRTALNPKPFLARVRDLAQLGANGVANLSRAYDTGTGKGWSLTALDVEGTAVKSLALADQLNRAAKFSATDNPAALNVPAPRSGGLSLVRSGRSLDVVAAFKRSTELLSGVAAGATAVVTGEVATQAVPGEGDGVELYAEDLIRGWRVDVFDTTTGQWRSLMRRNTDYTFDVSSGAGATGLQIRDDTVMLAPSDPPGARPLFLNEGVVQLGVTTSAKPSDEDVDTFVGEALLEWTGWSLVAPRPGRTLSAATNEPVLQTAPVNSDLDLSIGVAATPASLPRLRYGRTYRVRMRSANLAGNGPTLEETGRTNANAGTPTNPATYSRFEPIPAPVVVPRAEFQSGESLTELVIKSDDEFDLPGPPATTSRHLLAPAASAHLVELHGMLDAPLPAGEAFGLLSFREGLKLEAAPPVWLTMMPYGPPPAYPYCYDFAKTDPNSGDEATLYYDGELPLAPWLVDPAAAGVRIIGPEMGEKVVPYVPAPIPGVTTPWADPMSSRITMRGLDVDKKATLTVISPAASDVWRTRRFEVAVAKGEQFTIQVSSTMTTALSTHFGIVQLMNARVPAGLPARLGRIKKGANRVVSPPAVLRLVHAVRRPLAEPKILIATPSAVRGVGQTFADFGARMTCHPQSTSQVDWILSWSEPSDKPGDFWETPSSPLSDKPRTILGSGTTQPQRVDYPEPGSRPKIFAPSGLRHEFGDTKHRLVNVSLRATSRYARYFSQREHRVISSATVNFGSGPVQPFSERIVNETTGQTLQRDVDYKINYPLHEFTLTTLGQSRHLPPSGPDNWFYIDWVPDNVTRDTLPANVRQVHVRSSARPAAPVVREVFPLFVDSPWTDVKFKTFTVGTKRTRDGQALRVYLDRPWFSSGDDEKLAVILHRTAGPKKLPAGGVAAPPAGQIGVPKSRIQRYTTAWGRDPIVLGSPASATITASAFPRAVAAPLFGKWVSGLPVPGAETPVVAVPHEVEYDEELGMWFSDIQINLGNAYRPFVRLALARFQPYSLPGCHFSDVVLLDTAQLSPNRTLTLLGSGSSRTVSLTGPMYGATTIGTTTGNPIVDAFNKEYTRPPLFEVTVQYRAQSFASKTDSANIGWIDVVDTVGDRAVPRRYTLEPTTGSVPNGIGKYSVKDVDVSPPDNGLDMRLVIREYERDSRGLAEIIAAGDDPLGGYRRRVAWMDTFNIL